MTLIETYFVGLYTQCWGTQSIIIRALAEFARNIFAVRRRDYEEATGRVGSKGSEGHAGSSGRLGSRSGPLWLMLAPSGLDGGGGMDISQ